MARYSVPILGQQGELLGIACVSGPKPKARKCQVCRTRDSRWQCDGRKPGRKSKTCDRYLCDSCTEKRPNPAGGEVLDLCSECRSDIDERKPSAPVAPPAPVTYQIGARRLVPCANNCGGVWSGGGPYSFHAYMRPNLDNITREGEPWPLCEHLEPYYRDCRKIVPVPPPCCIQLPLEKRAPLAVRLHTYRLPARRNAG